MSVSSPNRDPPGFQRSAKLRTLDGAHWTVCVCALASVCGTKCATRSGLHRASSGAGSRMISGRIEPSLLECLTCARLTSLSALCRLRSSSPSFVIASPMTNRSGVMVVTGLTGENLKNDSTATSVKYLT
eukprot:5988868-Pyramimonas_sp.AAC.1